MNYNRRSLRLFFIVYLFGVGFVMATAQTTKTSLVISEVLLNKEQPTLSWVELYNPSDSPLVVKYFRASHIKTLSLFPPEVNKAGGIVLLPEQCIVLCANREAFTQAYGSEANCVEVPALESLAGGGFLAALTDLQTQAPSAIVRYGDSDRSSSVAGFATDQVLAFVSDGTSHARKCSKLGSGYQVSTFTQGSPTPGRANN